MSVHQPQLKTAFADLREDGSKPISEKGPLSQDSAPEWPGMSGEDLLQLAGLFADDPDFVRIMNEVYLETRGRLLFDAED